MTQSVCNSNPCVNNGICFEKRDSLSEYVCFCPPGFIGVHCEISFELENDVCKENLCKNGECISVENRWIFYFYLFIIIKNLIV